MLSFSYFIILIYLFFALFFHSPTIQYNGTVSVPLNCKLRAQNSAFLLSFYFYHFYSFVLCLFFSFINYTIQWNCFSTIVLYYKLRAQNSAHFCCQLYYIYHFYLFIFALFFFHSPTIQYNGTASAPLYCIVSSELKTLHFCCLFILLFLFIIFVLFFHSPTIQYNGTASVPLYCIVSSELRTLHCRC